LVHSGNHPGDLQPDPAAARHHVIILHNPAREYAGEKDLGGCLVFHEERDDRNFAKQQISLSLVEDRSDMHMKTNRQ
jgi:hypothetical protein